MKDFQDISGQTDETSHKSTCGRQCDICVEHALIKSHYLFLKSTSVGWEKYPDSCSHKDSQDRKMSEEGTEGSCFRFSVKAPNRCLFPLLSTNHHFSENLFCGSSYYDFLCFSKFKCMHSVSGKTTWWFSNWCNFNDFRQTVKHSSLDNDSCIQRRARLREEGKQEEKRKSMTDDTYSILLHYVKAKQTNYLGRWQNTLHR